MYKKEAWRYDVAKLRMLAAKINADILVVGKVNSDYNGDVGKYLGKRRTGMLSCKAEVNA